MDGGSPGRVSENMVTITVNVYRNLFPPVFANGKSIIL